MDKKAKIALVSAPVVVVLLIAGLAMAGPKAPKAKKECNDKSDNDGDGYIDFPSDPGCDNKGDASELNPDVECDDGLDNDGDNAIDYNDGGCTGPTDDDETDCGDSVCEGDEDCGSCAADCLGIGQVCCDGVAYDGDCCDDNDCTEPEACINHNCQIPDSCSDTDGGFNYVVQGTVSGYLNEEYYSYADVCASSIILIEWYCSGPYAYSWNASCVGNITSECGNGACV